MRHITTRSQFLVSLVGLAIALATVGCRSRRVDLTVRYATSLTAVLGDLSTSYHKRHANVHIQLDPSGSQVAARKISELGMKADVVAVADARLIDKMLVPGHAAWSAVFATNEIVIAHMDHSRFTDQVTDKNWPQFLTRPEIRLGRANPDTAPIGYNALFVWQLAERSGVFGQDGIDLERRLKARCSPEHVVQNEADLLSLLESRAIDYAFMFRSTVEDHHLKMVRLPDAMNLSRVDLTDTYAAAKVEVRMKQGDERALLTGAPVTYGVTIPKNAPHASVAADFLTFVMGQEGRRAFIRRGFHPLSPATCTVCTALPPALAKIVRPGASR